MRVMKQFAVFVLSVLGVCISTTLYAVNIDVKILNNIIATAEYSKGERDKPAVILLHGFLQTHHFQTVNRLGSYLADEGYTVLAPTLTLGVSQRKKSLSCEAIHLHSMEDDQHEIDFWVRWLQSRGHTSIVLVGHSYGSLQLLIYAANNKNPGVVRVIATSLVDIEYTIGREKNKRQINNAMNMQQQNVDALKNYQLNYCNKYVAPPAAFLSYAVWDKENVIKLLMRVSIPMHIIMGSKDNRADESWPAMLRGAHADVLTVEGAGHFFDAEYEFDLVDSVMVLMKDVRP